MCEKVFRALTASGGRGGGGEGEEELVKIYCMLCPNFKNSTLDKIDNFAPRHGISNNLASLESPNDGQSVAYES